MSEEKIYTREEERLNIVSHAVGLLCAVAVSVLFFISASRRGGDGWDLASIVLYAYGMLSSFAFSTAYHSARPGSVARRRLRKLDHAAIYWYIAGSYSPVTLIAMRDTGAWGWGSSPSAGYVPSWAHCSVLASRRNRTNWRRCAMSLWD